MAGGPSCGVDSDTIINRRHPSGCLYHPIAGEKPISSHEVVMIKPEATPACSLLVAQYIETSPTAFCEVPEQCAIATSVGSASGEVEGPINSVEAPTDSTEQLLCSPGSSGPFNLGSRARRGLQLSAGSGTVSLGLVSRPSLASRPSLRHFTSQVPGVTQKRGHRAYLMGT